MIFRRFTVGAYPINGYLVADPQTRIGVFIDPGGYHKEIGVHITERQINLRYIFFTHGHADHTEGLRLFRKRYAPQCYAGRGEVPEVEQILSGGEHLDVGNLRFTTFSTPGHSPGAISYYCEDRVFSGDALFCGSVGGTTNSANAKLQIEHVRRYLFTLPENTLVFPGHGPITTVAAEKYGNPFFRSPDPGPLL